MGHQFSKSENEDTSTSSNLPYLLHHPRNPFAQKAVLDNDGLSRTTEITDESMTPPPSPAVGKLRHRESWRRGATIPTYSSTALHLQVDGSHSVGQHYHHGLLPRRDSDPGKPRQPRTLPVKCPPSQRQIASGHVTPVNTAGGTASPKDGLEASYLERMYDSRTWEMYRRITEARKRARTIYVPSKVGVVSAAATVSAMDQRQGPTGLNPTAATTPSSEDTCEWEHLQQEEEPNGEESQHEMIFLFDF